MSPWLFDVFMDGYMGEVKAKVGSVGVKQCRNTQETHKIKKDLKNCRVIG